MEEIKVILRLPELEADVANQYARDLADTLKDVGEPSVHASVARENPEAQDFGATVVLILGTTAVTAVAQGIKLWLARHSGAKIEMLADGTLIARNVQSKDAAEIVKAMSKAKVARAAST